MDLRQLQGFVQVAETGSFTRASRLLGVAQPALSRQVRALEIELRQTLFTRTGRGVTLTEPGKRLLAHGRGILQQVARARLDLEEHRGAPVGHLAVGLPPSVGRVLTAPLVVAFRERFPQATLTVVEGLSAYVLEWLLQGRVDLAVVYQAPPDPAIERLPVLDEPLFLVSARSRRRGASTVAPAVGRAVSLAEVATHELVIPSRPHSLRMQLEAVLAAAGLKPRIGVQIESVPAILDLVQHHGLHAVLSLRALRGREAELQARPVRLPGGQALATPLAIATSAQRPRGPLLEQGVALVHELLLAPS
ncbi:MAG: LysR substrate-binding domain-containing protein [Rubrivivax sp.]|nr:LysR substrate-binding domain-containing protein [Rubrivivax sp.]